MIELLLAGIIATLATGALFGAPEPVRPSLYERFAWARMLAWGLVAVLVLAVLVNLRG